MGGILHDSLNGGERRTDDGVGSGTSGLECSRSQARPVEIRVGGGGGSAVCRIDYGLAKDARD